MWQLDKLVFRDMRSHCRSLMSYPLLLFRFLLIILIDTLHLDI